MHLLPFSPKTVYCKFPDSSIEACQIISKDYNNARIQICWNAPLGGEVRIWVPEDWVDSDANSLKGKICKVTF